MLNDIPIPPAGAPTPTWRAPPPRDAMGERPPLEGVPPVPDGVPVRKVPRLQGAYMVEGSRGQRYRV